MSNNTAVINTREAREKRDEEELNELLKAQNPPVEEEEVKTEEKGFTGHNWEQRYGELRSYAQKKENELQKKIKELEASVSSIQKSQSMPSTPEEFQNWVNEFPDAVRMMKTLIRNETEENVSGNVSQLNERIADLEYQLTKERASSQLVRIHPDAFEVINTQEFGNWLEDQRNTRGRVGQAMWDALNSEDFDVHAAADAISQYKQQNKKNKPEEKRNTRPSEAAFSVPSGNRNVKPQTNDGKRIYTEEEIEAMSPREFDSLEADIDAAWKEGRIMTRRAGAAF